MKRPPGRVRRLPAERGARDYVLRMPSIAAFVTGSAWEPGLRKALQTGTAAQLAVLDDASLTGTGASHVMTALFLTTRLPGRVCAGQVVAVSLKIQPDPDPDPDSADRSTRSHA